MGFLLLMFLAALILSVGALAIGVFSRGWRDIRTQFSLVLLACLFLSFAIGYGMVCYDPYWIDNEVEEFIEWGDRWSWAMMYAGLLQVVIIPIGLMVYGYRREKTKSKREGAPDSFNEST